MNLHDFCQISEEGFRLICNDAFHRYYHPQDKLQWRHRRARVESDQPIHDRSQKSTGVQTLRRISPHLRYTHRCHTPSNKQTLQSNGQSSNRKQIDSPRLGAQVYNGKSEEHGPTSDIPLHNGTRLPTSHWPSQKYPIPMRLLWFRTNHVQQPKVSTLLHRFDSEGMEIQVIESIDDTQTSVKKLACELIMLECINTAEQDMLIRLNSVRANSRVPLIVLTDNHTLDWSLVALREGADAIFTLNTPDDIIIARSNALLRRWLTD